MKTIKNFFTTIRDSFYNPSFYSRIKDMDWSRPFLTVIFLSFISVVVTMSFALPGMLSFAESIDTGEIKEYFPAELEISIKDGLAHSNIEGPAYFGEIPQDQKSSVNEKGHAVLIDTTNDYTLAELKEVDAYFVMTKDAFLGEDQGEVRLYYYADLFHDKEFTLNQEVIGEWLEIASEYATKPIVLAVYALAIAFLSIFIPVGWFVLALFFSIATMLIASIKQAEMRYGYVYKATLFGLIPLIIVSALFPGLPILIKLIMFVIIMWVNIQKA